MLKELINEYENIYNSVTFYTEDVHKTQKDKITEKIQDKFNLKDWEINILY